MIISFILCLFGGYLFGVHSKENDVDSIYHVCDSLERLSFIRVDAELPYYGMKQDDVLSMPPKATQVSDTIRLTDNMVVDLHGLYDKFQERLSGTNNEIKVMTFFWNFHDQDSSKLYIVFEWVDDSIWIANSCIQWKSKDLLPPTLIVLKM